MNFPTSSPSALGNGGQRIDIKKIIAQGGIETHFQPVVSIRQQAIVGVEALTRGIHEFDGRLILPATLFRLAAAEDLVHELDAVCRNRAAENFALLRAEQSSLLLFLNSYTPTLESQASPAQMPDFLEKYGLQPHNVVLEVVEAKLGMAYPLPEVADLYQKQNYLLALIGIGSQQSPLDRVTAARPDLFKIDKSLIDGLEHEEYKQELFKALVHLARRGGALTVAEGIETSAQAITALEMGADLLQGFYFARPHSPMAFDTAAINKRIADVAESFKQHMLAKINSRKGQHRSYNVILNSILAELSRVGAEQFDTSLAKLIALYPSIECAYVLDEAGLQVSETICNKQFHGPMLHAHIFQAAPRGTDHSLKEYFYLLLDVELNKFTTEPYVSLATGNLCITISTLFRDADNNRMFVLCIDVGAEERRF